MFTSFVYLQFIHPSKLTHYFLQPKMATFEERPSLAPFGVLLQERDQPIASPGAHKGPHVWTNELPKHASSDVAPSTVPLTSLPIFQPRETKSREEAFEVSYKRAQILNEHYGK